MLLRSKEFFKKNPHKTWVMREFSSHATRGKPLLFSRKNLLARLLKTNECWLCGNELKFEYKSKYNSGRNWNRFSPSVDIIDPHRPATTDNTQIICAHCNCAKNTFTLEEFIRFCQTISERTKEFPFGKKIVVDSSNKVLFKSIDCKDEPDYFPYRVKIQKCSGNSLYIVIPHQIVEELKLKQGVQARMWLNEKGRMEAHFE